MSMLCDRGIDMYGFDTGSEPPGTQYHYYDSSDTANTELDDFVDSKRMLHRLMNVSGSCLRVR